MDREPEIELLRELSGWQADRGIVSVYFEIDPADRGGGWRIALRHALSDVPESAAKRVLARFPENGVHPSGRTQIGFVEVDGSREEWSAVQMGFGDARAVYAPRPYLTPLVCLIDDGWPVGVVLASLERIRVLEWTLGRIEELDGWELEITSLDWRERKAPQRNAQTGTATSSAGHDQYRQRLEHNRERFLKEAGQLVASRYGERPWRHIVVVGDGDRPRLFTGGLGQRAELVHEVPQDLISAPIGAVLRRLDEEMVHLNRQREEKLVSRIEQAIGAEPGAALGPDEVLRALEEGRVNEVVFDPDYEFEPDGEYPFTERVIALATATSADVVPAEGLAAAALDDRGGVAALLRY
jgi:hypothetical protein